jgi:hypothetical protein
MKMKTQKLFVWVSLCFLFVFANQVHAQTLTSSTQEQQQKMQAAQDARVGDFRFRIKFVDEAGQPVSGIKVVASASKPKGFFDVSDETRRTDVNNNEYVQEFSHCYAVTLYLYPLDYHSTELSFAYMTPKPSVRVEGKTQIYDKEVVVFKRLPKKIAELRTTSENFEWDAKKGSKVLNCKTYFAGESSNWCTTATLLTSTTLPRMYLACVPSTVTIPPETINKNPNKEYTPRNAYFELRFEDAITSSSIQEDDAATSVGFMLIPGGGRNWKNTSISMTSAPEIGYQKTIRITNDMLRDRNNMMPLFFYFHIQGLYGKGKINGCQYMRHENKPGDIFCHDASVLIEFNVQPDGSRNVATRE